MINQYLTSNKFWIVRDEWLQHVIFFFFVHLTQVVVTSKILHVDRIQHQLSTHFLLNFS
jgi:hypothetical protein